MIKLRDDAVRLTVPILKRIASAFNRELLEAVITEEQRLVSAGIDFDAATLRVNPLIAALLSRRDVCAIQPESIDRGNSVGATQFFAAPRRNTPFQWLPAGFGFFPKLKFAGV